MNLQICGVDRLKVDAYFQKQCCMEIGFPIKEDDVKQKGLKGSDAFRAIDNYFQLAFKMGEIWDLIEEIFSMWDNIGIKKQKVKKIKAVSWSRC